MREELFKFILLIYLCIYLIYSPLVNMLILLWSSFTFYFIV